MEKRAGLSSFAFAKAWHYALRVFFFSLTIFGLLFGVIQTGYADESQRVIKQMSIVPLVHWQLARWMDGGTVCNLYLRHDSSPTVQEVSTACGEKIARDWLSTPACTGANGSYCSGLLLRQVSRSLSTVTTEVILPPISVDVKTVNCSPGQVCDTRPEVRVVANEPAQGYSITRVHVRIGGTERVYDGADAQIKLPLTDEKGDWIIYWAESSLGDESSQYQMKYRSVAVGTADVHSYRFDLIGDEWKNDLAPGAVLWEIFPSADLPLEKPYEQPLSPEYLATTNRYIYLAGHLIQSGQADASACRDRGLLPNGAASPCGEKAAARQVLEWQNKYDQQIYDAANKYNVPARLLKGMIAQESQFWPVSSNPYEQGLGYVTENGISMLLLWNRDYYQSLCVPVYGSDVCWGGYSNLRADRQTIVRRKAFDKIGTPEEVDLLAAMLYASGAQTAQLMNNVIHEDLSKVTTYEDMWKISIANYYAGSGCVGESLRAVAGEDPPISWDLVSSNLTGICTIAKDYVDRVVQFSQ